MSYNTNYHIIYSADDKFAMILGVSLLSLLDTNKDANDIKITILENHISQLNKDRINQICDKYHRAKPRWHKFVDVEKMLDLKMHIDRGSVSQYARLFISKHVDVNDKRVLYLDCDTIIKGSIAELWNLNLEGNIIAALKDAFSNLYRINIGLKKNDVMFNSGVMLIDLQQWYSHDIETRIQEFIIKKKGKVQQGDQGILNAVLSNKTYCFDPKYNFITVFNDFTYKDMMIYRKPPKDYYKEHVVEDARNKPVIIHYTTSFASERPWVMGANHTYMNEWISICEKSPWIHEPKTENNITRKKKIVVKIYKKLPYWFSLRIAGICQAYIRPFINMLKVG